MSLFANASWRNLIDFGLTRVAGRYGGYSSAGWGHGVRNIVFRTPSPSVGPETWIRMEDGETHARIILDASYN